MLKLGELTYCSYSAGLHPDCYISLNCFCSMLLSTTKSDDACALQYSPKLQISVGYTNTLRKLYVT